jgi:hypothetical protein
VRSESFRRESENPPAARVLGQAFPTILVTKWAEEIIRWFSYNKAISRQRAARRRSLARWPNTKLRNTNVTLSVITFIHSYVGNYFAVVGNAARAGVPHANVLCPILFNIYINDIPSNTERITVLKFADDTCISSQSFNPKVARNKSEEIIQASSCGSISSQYN